MANTFDWIEIRARDAEEAVRLLDRGSALRKGRPAVTLQRHLRGSPSENHADRFQFQVPPKKGGKPDCAGNRAISGIQRRLISD